MKGKLQQLKNQVTQHPIYAVLGGVLFAGVGFAAYKYLQSGKSTPTLQTPVAEEKSFQQTYKQVILAVQQSINKYQALNGEVIKCIIRNQYKLAQSQYKVFILKIRNLRRKAMKNKNEYRRLILSMENDNEELMDKNLNAILAHFNIQKTHWIETVELWSSDTQQNKQEWENLLIDLDNSLLDTLRNKSKSALPFNKLQEIYKYKIHSLDHLNESGIDFESSSNSNDEPDLNAKYTLIDKYIQDLVFNKFNVQEEDLLFSQNQLTQEDKDRIYQIEDEFTEKLRVAIYGDETSDVEQNVDGQNEQDWQDDEDEDGEGEVFQDEAQGQNQKHDTAPKGQAQEQQQDEGQYF